MRVPGRAALRRADEWTDHLFFAAWEVSVLAVPTLLLLLTVENRVEASLSATAALVVSALTVGTLRGEFVGAQSWPRPGHLGTLPGRSAYYNFVLGGATFLGVQARVLSESPWPAVVVPAFACAVALAFLPRALTGLRAVSRVDV